MTPAEVVRMLLDIVLSLVPHDEARQLLSDAAIARAKAAADAAEKVKFG